MRDGLPKILSHMITQSSHFKGTPHDAPIIQLEVIGAVDKD